MLSISKCASTLPLITLNEIMFQSSYFNTMDSHFFKILKHLPNIFITNEMQMQFSKNFALIKKKYSKNLNPKLSIEELIKCQLSKRKRSQMCHMTTNQIYVYLSLLTVYEIKIQKSHLNFTKDEWNGYGETFFFLDKSKLNEFNGKIFKKNYKNYIWSKEEDELLEKIINDHTNKSCTKVKWMQLSKIFNATSLINQRRTPHHLKERWENKLKKKFKRGDWQLIEDINILKFVLINGSKWSKLARQISDRNEHSLKNRFFSLLAKTTLTPIRKIKKLKIFLDKNNINDALTDLEAKLEIEIKEKTEKKDVFELSLFIENDKKEGGIMFNEEFLDVFESGRDLLPLWKI